MNYKIVFKSIFAVLLSIFCLTVFAAKQPATKVTTNTANPIPVGTWTALDDKTNKPRALLQVWEVKGKLYGKIIKAYLKPGEPDHCVNCPGIYKNKPVNGLPIMWHLQKISPNVWGKGEIMDPKNGKIYRCQITVFDNGNKLKVRGYIGVPMLGRTEIWVRAKSQEPDKSKSKVKEKSNRKRGSKRS